MVPWPVSTGQTAQGVSNTLRPRGSMINVNQWKGERYQIWVHMSSFFDVFQVVPSGFRMANWKGGPVAGASCRVQVGSSMTAKRSLKTLPRKIYSVSCDDWIWRTSFLETFCQIFFVFCSWTHFGDWTFESVQSVQSFECVQCVFIFPKPKRVRWATCSLVFGLAPVWSEVCWRAKQSAAAYGAASATKDFSWNHGPAKWKKPAGEVFSTCSEMTWDSMRFWFAGSKFQFGTWTQSVLWIFVVSCFGTNRCLQEVAGKALDRNWWTLFVFPPVMVVLRSKTSLVASEMAFTFQMILKTRHVWNLCRKKNTSSTMPQDISTCLKFHGFWW